MKKAILYSFFIHIALVILFYFIPVEISFYKPEFVEVGLLTPSKAVIPAKEKLVTIKKEKELVTLPESKSKPELPEGVKKGEKEPAVKVIEEKEVERETPSLGDAIESKLYTIIGEISKRKVIDKVIPQYPHGYNVQTEVSYELFVAPDGSIEKMILVKRGGEPFDKITLDALRQWKFERLAPNLPQKTQKGIITFIYRLE